MNERQDNAARRAAVAIAMRLREAGYTAYLAGGCVRDELLQLSPSDYDVATDARPEQVRRIFRNSKYVGEAFGVVLVRLDSQEVEVATFRTEWGYTDGRRPNDVQYSDAEHDAQRRDFTINGLFEDPATNAIIDYVGGQADLQDRIIRAIGDAHARFAEDYLRMLRAVRFAARLGFTIEPTTRDAICAHANRLGEISRERIGQEVQWMLTGSQPARAASLLQELRLDGPTLLEEHRDADLPTVAALAGEPPYPCVLAAWMIDRHVAGDAGALRLPNSGLTQVLTMWRRALCLSNEQRDAVRAIVQHLPQALSWDDLPVAQRKRLLARVAWPALHALLEALAGPYGLAELVRRIDRETQPLFAEGVAPLPLVTGDDLIAIGLTPGPAFKQILDRVYDEQLEGRIATREDALRRARECL